MKTREKLILKWQELEFEYNGEELKDIYFDDYSNLELEHEIASLEECLSNAFDELDLEK